MCQNGLAFGMVPAGAEMKSDTKIIGAVIGMGMLLVSVMAFQGASTNARLDDINARFDRMDARIDGMQYEFTTRIDGLRSDMREDHAAIHMRLDSLQETVLEIAQRLSRVEGRLGMPRGADRQATP